MSLVQYNSVSLPYAFITDLQQNVIYDDRSNTDAIYVQFDVTIQCLINSNYLSVFGAGLSQGQTNNPADIMKYIRALLMEPRKRFTLQFNGVDLIPDPIGPGTVDAMNGPKPQSCRIFPATNNTFLMIYRIIAHYHECNKLTGGRDSTQSFPAQNQPGNDVLYNRWTERVELDDRQFTRRIRNGKFVIRSDNPDGLLADELRSQMAVVGVPPGFLRESSSYAVDPSGLAIEYEIVDKEIFKLPPVPAFRASGQYMETTVFNPGVSLGRTLEARVILEGDKNTDQVTLIEKCIQVAAGKIYVGSLNPVLGGKAIPRSLTLNVDMYENKVECRTTAWAIPGGASADASNVNESFWSTSAQGLALTPYSEGPQGPAQQPAYHDRGTAGILLQAAAYYDPCLRQSILSTGTGQFSTVGPGEIPGTGGTDTLGTIGPGAKNNPQTSTMTTTIPVTITSRPITPGQNQSTIKTKDITDGNSMWTDFHCRMYYEKDRHLYMLPISSPEGFVGDSAAFVQMAAPTLLLIADWTASRFAQLPIIPDPEPLDPNLVLMDDHYELNNIGMDAGADRPLYRISGTYVYGHRRPPEPTIDGVLFPIAPWIEPGVFQRHMLPETLAHGIID